MQPRTVASVVRTEGLPVFHTRHAPTATELQASACAPEHRPEQRPGPSIDSN